MSININSIIHQAGLNAPSTEIEALSSEVEAIISYVEQLKNINTKNIAPFQHPANPHQAIRPDTIQSTDNFDELKSHAPYFDDDLFLVPSVL